MKILHTADWHIGKTLAGFDLLPVQQASFAQLRQVARDQNVDAMIIAGDLYDRGLANAASVDAVNDMLRTLNLDDQLPLLAIAGNHDSAARLATGRDWYAHTQLHLNTRLAEAFTPVVMGDTQFFLLPFFEPREAAAYFDDDSLTTLETAMARIVAALRDLFDADKKHVLVAHFFAAGSTHSGSETKVNVGGLDAVPLDLLEDFDYVALGHLHNRHASPAEKAPQVQYAGSLVKYDVSEVNQRKGVYILDTDTMTREFIELKQSPEFQHVTAAFDDIITGAVAVPATDYVAFTLTDTEVIPDLMARLRERYPYCVGVDREQHVHLNQPVREFDASLDPMALLGQFYTDVLGEELDDAAKVWAEKTLATVNLEE